MATTDLPNSSDQLATPLIQRPVTSTPPISTGSVSSSGLATPVSAFSAGEVVDDAEFSDSPTEPSTAGSNTSGYWSTTNVPSRPESRSSTLSGISTTAVKDGVEGRRVHHRSAEFKPSLVAAHHHHHAHPVGSNIQPTAGADQESQSSTSNSHLSPRTPTSSSTSSSSADDVDRRMQDLSAGSKPLYDDYEEYTNRLANA
ncbi:uncharacterized protein V1513DRAFT_451576 [Lipomyces chichibuensis]|uniref:uncharacterized protein n=1 Tax=Lipomyces chichibuensis TaxID=1546026 RepID=UPI003342E747